MFLLKKIGPFIFIDNNFLLPFWHNVKHLFIIIIIIIIIIVVREYYTECMNLEIFLVLDCMSFTNANFIKNSG